MSLKPEPIGPVPQETARLAKIVFPEGCTFIKMRDEIGTLFQDEMFATLFPKDGQPALAPWRLALVTIMRVGKTINSPLLTHKFANYLSLIRMFVLLFFDAYLRPNSKLTHKPA